MKKSDKITMKNICMFVSAAMLVVLFGGCKKTVDEMPVVTNVSVSDCHTATDQLAVKEFTTDSVVVSWPDDNEPMSVTHYNMVLDCGEPHITTRVERAGQVVTVVEEEGEQGLTDCICLYDNSFELSSLPSRPFTLVVKVESSYCGHLEARTVYEHLFE